MGASENRDSANPVCRVGLRWQFSSSGEAASTFHAGLEADGLTGGARMVGRPPRARPRARLMAPRAWHRLSPRAASVLRQRYVV